MQKARLFYTTWGSPRRAILSLALIAVFAAPLVFGLGAAPALAQTVTKPDPVTNVTLDGDGDGTKEVGETAAKVSWTNPTATHKCAHTRIDLRLYKRTVDDPVVMVITLPKTTTSYVVQGLTPSTKYQAEVYAFSWLDTCSGDGIKRSSSPTYSDEFTTGAAGSEGNPTKPGTEQKMPPKRPRNLSVSVNQDNTIVTINWQAAAADNPSIMRCPVSYYIMYLGARSDSELMNPAFPVIQRDIGLGETTPSTTTTVSTTLTLGKKYEVYVASLSLECREHSAAVRKVFTHSSD